MDFLGNVLSRIDCPETPFGNALRVTLFPTVCPKLSACDPSIRRFSNRCVPIHPQGFSATLRATVRGSSPLIESMGEEKPLNFLVL